MRETRIGNPGTSTAWALAAFAITLGAVQLTSPARLTRLVGARATARRRRAMRLLGAREIASGVAILARPRPSGPVWARVAGDALDLARQQIRHAAS